jgi:PAS domain S-box-containing protein
MNKIDLCTNVFGLDLIGGQIATWVNFLPNTIYIFDLEQRKLIFVNSRIVEILGYDLAEIQATNETIEGITIIDFPDELSNRFLGIKMGESIEFLTNFRHKNGQIHTFSNRGIVLKQNEIGENRFVMLIAEDITEKINTDLTEVETYRKELEQQLAALNKSNHELEQFAYVASHDLQEPLRKIKAFGERLNHKYKDSLGDEGKFFIDRMMNAAQRMNHLIEDLLTYSRASRNIEIPQNISLNEVVKNVLEDLDLRIQEEKATILVDDLPIIEAQSVQMQQLFQNLIENAIKFKQSNIAPIIKIKATKLAKEESEKIPQLKSELSYFRFNISDNGIGFEQKYAEQIFAIFQRLHGRTEYEGTGLGLAICRKIVETHQGFIEAFGEDNVGAEFIFYLPITTKII